MPEAAGRTVETMTAYSQDGGRWLELVLDDGAVVQCGGIDPGETEQ